MADEYIPFEQALRDLQMSEDELRRLVSQDQIQAIKRGDEIQIRQSDIDAILRAQSPTEEEPEELVFADEDEVEDDAGMVTAVLEDDSLLEEEETLDLAPEELDVGAVEVTPVSRSRSRRSTPSVSTPVRSRGRAAGLRAGKEQEGEETWVRALAIVTTVFLIFGFFVAHSITQGQVTGVTRWLADMFK